MLLTGCSSCCSHTVIPTMACNADENALKYETQEEFLTRFDYGIT